jgi:hypothetical protein
MRSVSRGLVCVIPAKKVQVAFAFLLLVCATVFAPPSHAEDLHYFKNYFVTGDYAVDGVGLYAKGVNGWATGTITPSDVPAGADIVAAFLYWETVETTPKPSSMNGYFDLDSKKNPYPIVGEVVGSPNTPPCWSQGGTGGPGTWLRVYRADVLRYLKVDSVNNVRLVDYAHTVTLPDSGINQPGMVPHTEGASLVVVYRLLPVGAAPYKAVVIYDGAFTMPKGSPAFAQTIGGFYQASGSGARMTQIVGNGQPGFAATLTVNGKSTGVSGTPFVGAQGPRWDNLTFAISLATGASSLTTQITSGGNQVCLSWGAVITSTNVVNTDGDGILDSWKTNGLHLNVGSPATSTTASIPATFGGCSDYPKDPCENFPAMGALPGHKDLFVQIDWLTGTDNGYAHIHSPKLAALKMIGDAFKAQNISVHFDVGNRYQGYPYIIPYKTPKGVVLAKGGNAIPESPTLECPNQKVPLAANCAFPGLPYSVMSWKKGFDAVKNGFAILGIPQYFPHDRKDTFHYVLFGHALAVSAAASPQVPVSVSGVADTPGGDLLVTLGLWPADDPKIAPNNAPCVQDDTTGTVPDANLCINQTGTSIQQAGTVMHELGHNMGLYHGGSVKVPNCMPDYPSVMNYLYQTRGLTDVNGNEQIDFSYGNLAPLNENKLSETTSLGPLKYRVRYYAPASAAEIVANSQAQAHCDGSDRGAGLEVRKEAPGLVTPDWDNNGGLDLSPVSVDIDFNGSVGDVVTDSVQPSDVNPFDPNKQWFVDYNDWTHLNFQQIGGRLNVDGLSADISASDLGQSDLGQSDLGQSDLGQSDLGQSDLGQSDLGQSDLGQSDLGGDVDYKTVISTLDATGSNTPLVAKVSASAGTAFNQVVFTWGAPSVGQIQTYFLYRQNLTAASSPIVGPVKSVSRNGGTPPVTTLTDTVNDFSLADSGANCPPANMCYNATYQYFITAVDINGTTSSPSNFVTATVDHIFVTPYSGSVVYGNTLPDYSSSGATITGLPSGALTPSTAGFSCDTSPLVTPRNVGPYTISCTGPATVGAGGVYGVTYNADSTGMLNITARPLTIKAGACTKTYDRTTTAPGAGTCAAATVTGLAPAPWEGFTDTVSPIVEVYQSANVMGSGGSTLQVSSYSVNDQNGGGNYSVTLATTSGTISARPITVTAVTTGKVYDGTKTANQSPAITSALNPPIVAGDTANFFEAYYSQDVMAGQTLIPFGSVSDGNNGNNYAVTFTPVAGTISAAPLTITAITSDKTYDGTNSSTATPTYSALAGAVTNGDTITGLAETYDTPNAGTGKTMSVSAYTINDGNNGNNYSVTPVTNTTGEIDTQYTSDATLADFTNPITNWASFNSASSSDMTLPYTPTAAILDTGDRVVGSSTQAIVVQFSAPVSRIRVFPNIDHYGSSFDGFQYSISGSTDGVNWTPLFDATSVTGTGEPFTLGTFIGTEPNVVNNVLTNASSTGTGTGGVGTGGTIGYVAEFVFSQAYTYYSLGPSTVATNSGNADQELSGVAALP